MKKFLTIIAACAYLLPLFAQNGPCNAGFDFEIAGNTVKFKSGNPTSHPQRHYWSFGDGGISDNPTPSHTYNGPGQYRVVHYVKDTLEHCFDSVVKYITIQRPDCNLNANFTIGRDNENCRRVKFTSYSVSATTNMHFIWKFGDGTTSAEANPTHIYANDGNYNVCLVIETNTGCRVEQCKTVEIHCAPPPPPTCDVHAKFEIKREAAQWNKVWFMNVSQPVSTIWKTYWTYGDGTVSQDFNSFHVYQQPGKYYVCLKVQSLQGCISTYCDSVVIRKPENCENHADFKFERSTFNPHEIRFRPLVINLMWKYKWEFGDGTSSTAVTPVHVYADSGNYKACLIVTTNTGCKTYICKPLHVENGRVPGTVNIYPNPVNSIARIEYQLENPAQVKVKVMDAAGSSKLELTAYGQAGNNYLILPVDKLTNGFYFVELRYGNQVKMVKFQKG